jgi:hypothetical protein
VLIKVSKEKLMMIEIKIPEKIISRAVRLKKDFKDMVPTTECKSNAKRKRIIEILKLLFRKLSFITFLQIFYDIRRFYHSFNLLEKFIKDIMKKLLVNVF